MPLRIQWLTECFDADPAGRVIEFGCGNGAAIAALLDCGRARTIDGLDRSAIAISRATRTNSDAIAHGRVRLIQGDFTRVRPARRYNNGFAINVNAFWVRPESAFSAAVEWIARGGRLLLIYEAPGPTKAEEILRTLSDAPDTSGFEWVGHQVHRQKKALVALQFRLSAGG